MSDYTVTHGHLDDRHFQSEYDAWLDSLPQDPNPIKPTCGQCKHFEVIHGHLDAPNEGICRLRTYLEFHDNGSLTLCEEREAFDDICDRYVEKIPF